jgi:hypothetical protein
MSFIQFVICQIIIIQFVILQIAPNCITSFLIIIYRIGDAISEGDAR